MEREMTCSDGEKMGPNDARHVVWAIGMCFF